MVAGELLGLLAWHLILTALPAIAVTLYVARRGVTSLPVLLAVFLAASGLVGLLGFWTYYADPLVGKTYSVFVLLGSVQLSVWSIWGWRIPASVLRGLATPLALWAFGSAFLLLLGFFHGGTATPILTSTTRFSHPLPTDSEIPHFFANWFYVNGHHGTPPVFPGEWLFSDRPPLQVGYTLYQRPFGGDVAGLNYQILGVVLQQLWIVGLWALLLAVRLNRVTRGMTMVVVLLSDLTIVNGFFVWPKLLPAAMLLGAAALVMTPLWKDLRRNLWAAALVAGLCGLAMLGHGASVFGVIPLALVALYRGLPSWRWIGVGLAVGIVLMGSWSAYQKWGDPPGNRLTKWTLAGEPAIDGRGTFETIEDSYREAGFSRAFDNHVENFQTMIGGPLGQATFEELVAFNSFEATIRAARLLGFYFLLPSLGLLLLGPLAMLVRWRRRDRANPEWGFALTCFGVYVIGAFVWGLIVFGGLNDLTVVHISSYLLPILGMAGCVAGLRAAFPRFAIAYLALSAALSLFIYVPSFEPPPGTSFSPLAAVIAALAALAFVATALGAGWPRLPEALRVARSDQFAHAPQA
jgi:hypothetical protein